MIINYNKGKLVKNTRHITNKIGFIILRFYIIA